MRERNRGTGAFGAAGRRGTGAAAAALAALVALSLGACGTERPTAEARGGTETAGGTKPSGGTETAGGAAPRATGTAPSPSPSSPYVEPGAGEGAPHYRENNGFRISGDMSAASAEDARREAGRIEPVLKRLWQQGKWDPRTVRAALLGLGYGGTLRVEPMDSRFVDGREVRPEGALVGLRVHDDACVTAFVQKTNYQVSTNGPYPETGCFEPPAGH
ncbi:hypothetical protein [Streptomyces cinerochromogenes]|uniref:hypothetical protein n=1 Tax=Streptomyces cinerochromogenes TaxID=66422 RepID=UPI0019948A27|nr:hypothetical protein [Streptomyces cinerochromogenes]GGS54603.1 hypothetical protein GCM10010206_15420 [Streptomyces cinerochromogenes]